MNKHEFKSQNESSRLNHTGDNKMSAVVESDDSMGLTPGATDTISMNTIQSSVIQMNPITPIRERSNAAIIQKDDDESVPSPDAEESSFDFDFNALPPSLQLTLGQWMLQANTSRAALQYTQNLMRYSLGYSYGGNITAGLSSPGFSTSLGFNPDSGDTSFNLSRDQFRFGASANPITSSFGLNFGYGASLLPMPSALTDSVSAGWAGASSVLGGIPGMDDPLSFYQAHGDNIDAIMNTVKTLQSVQGAEANTFGAGLRLTYNPQTGLLVSGGMQWIF